MERRAVGGFARGGRLEVLSVQGRPARDHKGQGDGGDGDHEHDENGDERLAHETPLSPGRILGRSKPSDPAGFGLSRWLEWDLGSTGREYGPCHRNRSSAGPSAGMAAAETTPARPPRRRRARSSRKRWTRSWTRSTPCSRRTRRSSSRATSRRAGNEGAGPPFHLVRLSG